MSDRTFLQSLVIVAVLAGVVVPGVAHTQSLAPSLARPTSPVKPPNADGFLQRWLLLEPIAVSGQLTDTAVQSAVKTASLPDPLTAIPRDGDTVSVGNTTLAWHAVDTIGYQDVLTGASGEDWFIYKAGEDKVSTMTYTESCEDLIIT